MAPKPKAKPQPKKKTTPAAPTSPEMTDMFLKFMCFYTFEYGSGYTKGIKGKTSVLLHRMVWATMTSTSGGVTRMTGMLKAKDIEYADRYTKIVAKIETLDKANGGKLAKMDSQVKDLCIYIDEVDGLNAYFKDYYLSAKQKAPPKDIDKKGNLNYEKFKLLGDALVDDDDIYPIYEEAYLYTIPDFDIDYFFRIYWKTVFWLADKNKDGKISKAEFEFATGFSKPQSAAIFKIIDKDGDGTLDLEEVQAGSSVSCESTCAVM